MNLQKRSCFIQTKKPDAFKAPNMNHWYELEASDNNDKLQINKAQDDLKNMLLASLQMQHLVVLAGSGCSISAGGPSM